MHPILFQWGPIQIYYYGVLVALAFLFASMWVIRRALNAGEDPDAYLQAIVWIAMGGFIGARLMYVFYYPDYYLSHPMRILLDRGGLVWYGGMLFSTLVGVVYVRVKQMNVLKFADITSAPAALGLAIGRIGCFMTGCCYGKETHLPWGVHFPAPHATFPHAVHPTQLYETLAMLMVIPILEWVYRSYGNSHPGRTMAAFFILAGLVRFGLEFLRGDEIFWVGNLLSASQVFSLLAILAGTVMILANRRLALQKPPVSSL